MSSTDKHQQKIQRLLSEAMERVRAAEKIAREHKLSFSFDVAYGMGGWFEGDPAMTDDAEPGWKASSHSC